MTSSLNISPSAPLSPFSSGVDDTRCIFDQVPSTPRPDYGIRSCVQFEEGQLQGNAPLLPMLSDEEDEATQTHDESVLLRPRPASSSIFRSNLSSIGISMASSVCSSSEECPSLASSLEESYGMSDDDLSEVESVCFLTSGEKRHDLNLVYLQPENGVSEQDSSDVFSLRPRSSVQDFDEYLTNFNCLSR